MMGTRIRNFVPLPNLSLEELVPKENFDRRLDRNLDLSFVRALLVEECFKVGLVVGEDSEPAGHAVGRYEGVAGEVSGKSQMKPAYCIRRDPVASPVSVFARVPPSPKARLSVAK